MESTGTSTEMAGPDLLPVLLDLGAAMLVAGADVSLVERTLDRVGCANGARSMNVFVITAIIMATMTLADGTEYTQTRRIDTKGDTNFDKLEKLNGLAWECCQRPVSADALAARLRDLDARPFPRAALYSGGVLAAASFAVFFGGTPLDGAVSALFALFICFLTEHLKPLCPNNIVFNFVAALLSGLGIGATALLVPALHPDMVIIGDIMLLIPGIAMTNAARDMLTGDTIAGVMRLIESLLWACALALGFMLALLVFGSLSSSAPALSSSTYIPGLDAAGFAWLQLAMALPASLGFALLFNLRRGLLVPASLGGVLAWGIYLACGKFVAGIFIPCLVASAFAALFAQALARRNHAPSALFFIIAVIPLIPGRALFYTMDGAVRGNWAICADFGLLTAQFALAIAVGISLVWAVLEVAQRAKRHRC